MPVVTQGSCLQSFLLFAVCFDVGGNIHLHHAKHQPATSWSLQGSNSNASQKMGHHHALDDIHTSWGSVISRQIPPEVTGVWSVCVGVQILNLRLSRWPKMSRDEINMHKNGISIQTSEVTKSWPFFCIFGKYLGVPKKTKVGQPWRLTGFLSMIGFTQYTERLHGMPTKHHRASLLVTFLGWLSDPFKGQVPQVGDQKVTLNHLAHWLLWFCPPFFSVPTWFGCFPSFLHEHIKNKLTGKPKRWTIPKTVGSELPAFLARDLSNNELVVMKQAKDSGPPGPGKSERAKFWGSRESLGIWFPKSFGLIFCFENTYL